MPLDIIIFAVVAAVLVVRLKSVLGTKHGEEKPRGNPFEPMPEARDSKAAQVTPLHDFESGDAAPHMVIIDDELIKSEDPEQVREGVQNIAHADRGFDLHGFMQGARMAFQMITEAFAKGDTAALKPLLSDDLYKGFEHVIESRAAKGHTASYELHRIKEARIADARLGGVMAYVTVDFDIEHTSLVKDSDGKTVEGDPDKIAEVHDVWTFARDVRSPDPNWELVSTRIGDG